MVQPRESQSREVNYEPNRANSDDSSEKIGIYGWRQRCLLLVVVLLTTLVAINVLLTVWIMNVLQFSLVGIGRLLIYDGGLKLNGQADFFNTLYASRIRSLKREALKIRSYQNITLQSRNKQGRVNGKMTVGQSKIDVIADRFTVRNPVGKMLFHRDENNVFFGVDTLKISGQRKLSVRGSIQTPAVRAENFQPLKFESFTRKIKVLGPERLQFGSRSGRISLVCSRDLTLLSTLGMVNINSETIIWKNLRMALPTTRGRSYAGIYQLCACENGKLFAASPTGQCYSDNNSCK